MKELDPLSPLTAMTRKPAETRLLHEVDAVYTFHLFRFRRAMRRARLFINGGGSLIQDTTSSRSLYFYLYTIYIAHKLGCKVQMYGCGVGHVSRPFNRRLAGRVLNRSVDIITLRDTISQQELSDMHVVYFYNLCRPLPIPAGLSTAGYPPGGRSGHHPYPRFPSGSRPVPVFPRCAGGWEVFLPGPAALG